MHTTPNPVVVGCFVPTLLKRLALVLAALLLLAAASPARQQSNGRALIIGINSYPGLGLTPLTGAEADAASMKELAGLVAGYNAQALVGSQAKLEVVKKWMDDVLDDANARQVLIYFSGYGSVARNTDKESRYQLVPSLVLADSNPNDSKRDLPLSDLEKWSHELASHGRSLTVILDAAYTPVTTLSRDFEAWQWKSTSKCFARGKVDTSSVRPDVWIGAGACLCATPTIGGAYEIRNDLEEWHGVFTETLIEWAEPEMVAREKPTARDVIRQIGLALNPVVGNSYLTGERVIGYPAEGTRLDDVFLTDQPASSGLPAGMVRIAQQTKKLQGRFRIALDSDNEHVNQLTDIAKKLQASIPDIYIVERNQLPDRVIEIGADRVHPNNPKPGDVHLQSGEASEVDDVNDFDSATEWPVLQNRLLKAWYGEALFRSAEDRARSQNKLQQATAGWTARPDSQIYHLNDNVSLIYNSSQPGALLILYRDDINGFIDDLYPGVGAPDMNIVQQGDNKLGLVNFSANTPETRTELACYFIAPSLLTPKLPDLMKADEKSPDPKEEAQFDAEMVKVLHDIWAAVQSGKPGWSSCLTSYTFRKGS